MLPPEEICYSALIPSAEHWQLVESSFNFPWSELLWFLNASILQYYHFEIVVGYPGRQKFHKVNVATVASYYSTPLEFNEFFRATHSFPNIFTVKADCKARCSVYSPVTVGLKTPELRC